MFACPEAKASRLKSRHNGMMTGKLSLAIPGRRFHDRALGFGCSASDLSPKRGAVSPVAAGAGLCFSSTSTALLSDMTSRNFMAPKIEYPIKILR